MNSNFTQASSLASLAGEDVKPPAELPHVLHRLDHALERLHGIASCLETHADRLHGPRTTGIGSVSPIDEPLGLFAILEQRTNQLHDAISRVETEADRNTRLA